jgi:thioredoxin 1
MTEEKMPTKNKNLIIAGAIIAVILIGGGAYAFTQTQTNKPSDSSVEAKNAKTANAAGYIDYSADIVKMASTKDVVLFFKASWCPTCNATDKDINANLSSIPENLIIAKVDYDKEVGLKQKYSITMQHTFVKIDQNGNELAKKNGLNTLEEISNFAKANSTTSNTTNQAATPINEIPKTEVKSIDPSLETPKANSETTPVEAVGTYTTYSADMLSKASTGNVVLFFKASWCPTCVATEKDINSNLGKIPSNLTILAVDYDKETELKKKYGITTQHSFVKVDKDGNELKKSPYGQTKTLENIIDFAS